MSRIELPYFPFHRDPVASGSVRFTDEACDCCGKAKGALYTGSIYAPNKVERLCPWCIFDGSADVKYGASFFDAHFCDDDFETIEMPDWETAVFSRTIGFATYNPIGWWVHCGEPAEYVTRNEPYEMVFECRKCGKRHIVPDYD